MNDELGLPTELPSDFATACACFNVRKAARAVTAFYDSVLQPTGLRSTQATLLMAIASAGAPTISRLAEALMLDRTTLARDVKLLAEQALVRVTPGDDQRTRQLRLTDAGRAKLRQVIPLWEQAQTRLIAEGLGPVRWGQLYADLQEVVRLTQG